MSVKDLLIKHAYDNVWCAPGVDSQFILSPTRITPVGGVFFSTTIDNSIYNLPKKGPRFDIFTFGDILPQVLGLRKESDVWIPASRHGLDKNLLIHIYNKDGVHFPLDRAWFLHTRNGNLVVAILREEKLVNFSREDLYIRFRSAAYFRLDDNPVTGVKSESLLFKDNDNNFMSFRERFLNHKSLDYGHAFAFVNGRRVRDFNHNVLKTDDVLEYLWDGDVKEVVELPLTELRSFQSELDEATKFFFNRAGIGEDIDFVDDTDFYLLNYTKPNEYTGIYYHQNDPSSIRMVTHRDYSIKSLYINAIMNREGWSTTDDIRVEAIIRYSGFDRDLVDDHFRLHELFKLEEADRLNAMFGSEMGVDVWRASNLEKSMYLTIMGKKYGTITSDEVMEAYGYNAVTKLVSNLPLKITDSSGIYNLGYNNFFNSVVYEYREDGLLLGYYNHKQGRNYSIRNQESKYLEVYNGSTGDSTKTIYNSHKSLSPTYLDLSRDYRFYKTKRPKLDINTEWEDITGNEDYYSMDVDKVIWTSEVDDFNTAIRNDLDFVTRDVMVDSSNGDLVFTINTLEKIEDKVDIYTVMTIPPGEVDIFLNGHELIERIDYYMEWPEISIHSLKHRDETLPQQKVTYRLRGFCKEDLTLDTEIETGFVVQNQISRNGKYNLRDDKITRVSIGGKLRTPDEVDFAEEGTFTKGIPNGTPYKITHPYIPLLGLLERKTYDYRKDSIIIDKQIEGYMDIYKPEEELDSLHVVEEKYHVISPFISKIIEDVVSGFISMNDFKEDYSQHELKDRFKGYTYLLKYDPVLKEERKELFLFRPHVHDNLELDVYQYKLIERLISTYLDNKIDLSRYVTLIERG